MKHILAIIDDVYEDLELWYPKLRLEEEGWNVVVAAPALERTYTGKHGYPCVSDAAIHDVAAEDYDALLLPGGFAPDKLRRDPKVLELVREFQEAGKPIAHICHAGWIMISAKVLKDKRTTSTVGIKDDMANAGGIWMDEPVVIDGNQIASRTPKDLPAFSKALVDMIASVSEA
ncbi:MAG: type 1 glutamine amidotransferase [Verrucomicrobia bacterium]|nr:type 1 glutamine amidotransferase [Verrucomicrobiota bacterium]MCH8512066.1 type 1 glutamine amidotransferase [Kiritimatiellia bacterium]